MLCAGSQGLLGAAGGSAFDVLSSAAAACRHSPESPAAEQHPSVAHCALAGCDTRPLMLPSNNRHAPARHRSLVGQLWLAGTRRQLQAREGNRPVGDGGGWTWPRSCARSPAQRVLVVRASVIIPHSRQPPPHGWARRMDGLDSSWARQAQFGRSCVSEFRCLYVLPRRTGIAAMRGTFAQRLGQGAARGRRGGDEGEGGPELKPDRRASKYGCWQKACNIDSRCRSLG